MAVGALADQRRVMARSLAYLWTAGSALMLLTIALPHGSGVNETVLLAEVIVACILVGVMLGVRGLPLAAFEVVTALGTMMIALAVVMSDSTTSAYAFFLVWLTVHTFYFLSWPRATAQLALSITVYAGALLVAPSAGDARWVRFAMVSGTLIVTSAFVGLLRARVDRLVHDLSDAARRDYLTGLLNRRGFEDALEDELERVERGAGPLSLLITDLDHFKRVNDTFGHDVGDLVLCRVALAIEDSCRRIDTAARIGGEEFALLLPDTDVRSAFVAAERLCEAIRSSTGDGPDGQTTSIGVATCPADGRDAQTLVRAADQALYAAKTLGRDRVVIHSPDLEATLRRDENRREERVVMELATALALADALDLRDEGAGQHSRAVAGYAQLTAIELGLPTKQVERVRLAGLLHDIGKIGVPDGILDKPGPLDPDEWAQMRKHPEIGASLLAGEQVADIRAWVLAHHERPDGRGYPYGIAAPAIPLEALIVAAADALEAMTTDRIYRPAIGHAAAIAELRQGAGTQFDERVVEALVTVLARVPAGIR